MDDQQNQTSFADLLTQDLTNQDPASPAVASELTEKQKKPVTSRAELNRMREEQMRLNAERIMAILEKPLTVHHIVEATGIHYRKVGLCLESLRDQGLVKSGQVKGAGLHYHYRAADKINLDTFAVRPHADFTEIHIKLLCMMPESGAVPARALYREIKKLESGEPRRWSSSMAQLVYWGYVDRTAQTKIASLSLADRGRNHPAYQAGRVHSEAVAASVEDKLPSNRIKLLAVIDQLERPTTAEITLALGDQYYSKSKGRAPISAALRYLVASGQIVKTDASLHARSTYLLTDLGRKTLQGYPDRSSLPSTKEMRRLIEAGLARREERHHVGLNEFHKKSYARRIVAVLAEAGPLTIAAIMEAMPGVFSSTDQLKKNLYSLKKQKRVAFAKMPDGGASLWQVTDPTSAGLLLSPDERE